MARIAHFIDTHDSGGAERVLVELCAHLPQLGHEVEVHHFGNVWIEKEAPRLGLTCVRLGHGRWYRSKWSVGAFGVAFGMALRRRRIDLLHSHLNGPIAAGAVAAVVAGIPHVGTLHDVYHVAEQPAGLALLRLAARLGTQLIAVSDDMRRFYRATGSGALRVERVYNGIDTARYRPAPPRGKEPFTFISVGRLVPLKGHDVLLRALAHKAAAGVRLRFLGQGEHRAALERLAAELGVGSRVEFLGFRDDVAETLADADAFALASYSEGLSCSVMEAMAAGLPCLVTDVGGNRELVAEGVTGLLAPPGDPAALARRMGELAGDRARAQAMGRAARERAETRFSIAATLRAYDEIYRSLLPVSRAGQGARAQRGAIPAAAGGGKRAKDSAR